MRTGTKEIEAALEELKARREADEWQDGTAAAFAELAAIRTMAKDLTRLNVGDGVYEVRERHHVISATPHDQSTWNHPDVKAWSDAAQLLEAIAKETP